MLDLNLVVEKLTDIQFRGNLNEPKAECVIGNKKEFIPLMGILSPYHTQHKSVFGADISHVDAKIIHKVANKGALAEISYVVNDESNPLKPRKEIVSHKMIRENESEKECLTDILNMIVSGVGKHDKRYTPSDNLAPVFLTKKTKKRMVVKVVKTTLPGGLEDGGLEED